MNREAMWVSHEERWRAVTLNFKVFSVLIIVEENKTITQHTYTQNTRGEESVVSQTWRRLEHSTTSEKKCALTHNQSDKKEGIFVFCYRDNFKWTCFTHCCLNPFFWECYLARFPHAGSQEEPRGEQMPFSHRQVLGWSHLNSSAISKASRVWNLVKSIFFCPSACVDICPHVPAVVCPLTILASFLLNSFLSF